MREIDFYDQNEKEHFITNRVERLAMALEIDNTNPAPQITDLKLIKKLKAHAIYSYRRDLQIQGKADLADFIINPPHLDPRFKPNPLRNKDGGVK